MYIYGAVLVNGCAVCTWAEMWFCIKGNNMDVTEFISSVEG